MTNDEIVSVFIDGEPVDPDLLARALADPAGRTCLVDLLRLGALVVEAETEAFGGAPSPVRKEPRVWLFAAAAALVVGLGAFAAGMQVGYQTMPTPTSARQEDPPKPDRVIELREGIEWRNNVGGM